MTDRVAELETQIAEALTQFRCRNVTTERFDFDNYCSLELTCNLPDVRYEFDGQTYIYSDLWAELVLVIHSDTTLFPESELRRVRVCGPRGQHPHIGTDDTEAPDNMGRMCSDPRGVDEACSPPIDPHKLALALVSMPAQFSPGDWYRPPNQPALECAGCEEFFEDNDDMAVIGDLRYCECCHTTCDICDDCLVLEGEDITTCASCEQRGCSFHFNRCSDCGTYMCELCTHACEDCGQDLCPGCAKFCWECSQNFCGTCMPDEVCDTCLEESLEDEEDEELEPFLS